jgi:lysozyme
MNIMEIKKTSKRGLDFIAKEEGVVLKPYKCSAGVVTIGIGSTYYEDGTKIKMTDAPITKERAYALFQNVLKHYEMCVYTSTRDDINQNQFDALVSLAFNIGTHAFKKSTLVKRVNKNPKGADIKGAFLMWKNAGGKPILLNRRKREYELYASA